MKSRIINLIFLTFLSLVFLVLIYDLFFELDRRVIITSQRNFPRYIRLFILFLMAACYLILSKTRKKNKIEKYLLIIYSYIIIHIVLKLGVTQQAIIEITKLLYILFTYLFCYKIFILNNFSISNKLKLFSYASVFILSFFIILTRLGLAGSETIFIRNYGDNNSYLLLSFLPFMFLKKSKQIDFLILLLIFVAVIFSLKRGAILIISLLIILKLFFTPKNKNQSSILRTIALYFSGIFFVLTFILSFTYLNDFFVDRFKDFSSNNFQDIGSGRGIMYTSLIIDWFNSSDFIDLIFGRGYRSTNEFIATFLGQGLNAHSDFITFLYNYGILGFCLFFLFIKTIVMQSILLYRNKHFLFFSHFTVVLIVFLKSIFSINFESIHFAYLLIFLSYINSVLDKEKNNEIKT